MLRRALHVSARALKDVPAAAAASETSSVATGLRLNLALPSGPLVQNKAVKRVTVPGAGGHAVRARAFGPV